MWEWMRACVCLCLSTNNQLTSYESTHRYALLFFSCWPSLGLSLAPHFSLSTANNDRSQRHTVTKCLEPIYTPHPRPFSPIIYTTPSASLPPHPTISQIPILSTKHGLTAQLPIPHRHYTQNLTIPFPK